MMTAVGTKTAQRARRLCLNVAISLILTFAGFAFAGCSGVVSGNSSTNTPPPSGDTTPPTISVTSPAANATVSGNVNVTATASDNVAVTSVQFKVDGNNAGTALTAAPYSFVLDTKTLNNANHALTAVATDAAGNSATSTSVTVRVDNTTADTTPPSVSITGPANGATVSGTVSVMANASDNVSVASVQFQLDGANAGAADVAAPYSYSWNTTSATNGAHTLRVIAKDGAGNSTTSAAVTVTVSNTTPDTTAPTVSISAPAAGATVSGTVSVTANASDNIGVASVQFQLDGANVGSADTTSPYSFSWNTTTATNGSHSLRAVAKDAAGNSTTSAAVTVTVSNTTPDTTAPTVSISAPAAGATVSGTVSVTANASDNIGVASVQFQLDGANVGSADTTSPYSFSWNTTTATNGSHSLRAVAKDAAGNSTTSAAVTVTVSNTTPDTTAPTVSISAPAAGATVSGTVSVTANASDNIGVASVQFQLDGANVGSADTTSPYSFSWNTTTATNGSHSLRAVAKDAAGNSTTSAAVTVTVSNATDTTPPTVPTNLTATAASSSQINLAWSASTDNVAVTGYKIFRGGTQIGTSPSTNYQDAGLNASTSYTYTVAATDGAGNTSAQSAGASATTQAASSGGGGLPAGLGWYQIPNTTIQAVAPSASTYPEIQGNEGPSAVVADWSGALSDTKRSQLVIWGGGHSGYFGNELYALNMTANPITLTRLTTPSHGSAVTSALSSCSETYGDGLPAARHTYNGLWYMSKQDTYYMAGAGIPPCGNFSNAVWSFNPSTSVWTNTNAVPGPHPAQNGSVPQQAYDSVTGLVYEVEANTGIFWSFSPSSNTWTSLANVTGCYNLNATSTIDSGRRLYFCIGNGGFWKVSLNSPYSATDIKSASGCGALVSAQAPGFDLDTIQNVFVGWAGGNTVYLYNPDTNSCTSQTYASGPGSPQGNGTYGRWKFFSSVGVFALVNAWNQNAWALRIDNSSGTGGSSAPVISSVAVNSITTSGATVSWTTDVASTTQVEYGLTTVYGSSTTVNSSMVTTHSQALSGLVAGTLYHYRVHSKNGSGVESVSSDMAFSTNNTTDTTAPTVSVTSPASGATVSGTVTVSATASDNVGVMSVQFVLDGANLGSLDTASPYTVSWDTTTTNNGTHTLSAIAKDAAGNTGNAVSVTVTVSNSGSTSSALQDFQFRCSGPGVIVCEGFDSATEFVPGVSPNTGLYSNSGNIKIVQDTTEYASGGGALKFPLTANGAPVRDNNWLQNFCSAHPPASCTPQVFQENSDFYIQFRYRVDTGYLQDWEACCGSSPKIFDVAHHTSSCGQTELTVNNRNGSGKPMAYGGCGAYGMFVNTNTGLFNQNTPYNFQSGFYNCEYPNTALPPGGCFTMPSNRWMTFYEHVHIGNYGANNSVFELWVSTGTNTPQYLINIQDFVVPNPDGGVINGYDAIWFNVYMTNFSGNNQAANVWLDEVIVSTQPIPPVSAATAVP